MSREFPSEQNSKTYSYNEEETESDSTNLVWKIFEIRHAKLLIVHEFRRYHGTPEENWSENVKQSGVGKTENCTSNLKLNQYYNNVLTSAQQNTVRELKAASKLRPMRKLRDLQKRKYDTSPLLLGVHGVRMQLGNGTETALELLEMEPLNDDTQSRTHDDDDDTILKKGEFFVFRGTDGLPSNILQLTKDHQEDSITPKTRIKRNFLTSEDHKKSSFYL